MIGTARKKQETLVLFPEVLSITQKFTDAQFGILMRAAFSYRFAGEVYSGDDVAVDVAFRTVASQIDRYQEFCNTQSMNAKGSEVQPSAAKYSQMKPKSAKYSQSKPSDPPIHVQSMSNPCPYPIQSMSDQCVGNEEDAQQKPTRFSHPSADDVRKYCDEHGYTTIDPERFVSYYAARQWMSGQTAITDWRAAVDSWHRKDVDKQNGNGKTEPKTAWTVGTVV